MTFTVLDCETTTTNNGDPYDPRNVLCLVGVSHKDKYTIFDITHLDDWVAWAYANGIDERLIAFLRFRPELLFDFDPAHNPVAFPSPRSWEFAHRALQKFGTHSNLLVATLQACVGPAAGIELAAFVENLD